MVVVTAVATTTTTTAADSGYADREDSTSLTSGDDDKNCTDDGARIIGNACECAPCVASLRGTVRGGVRASGAANS